MRRWPFLLALVAAPVAAQPATGFDAGPAPLADVLALAARRAGVGLSYDPALVAGRTARCRTDARRPAPLFACVLAGTGLVAVQTGPTTYTLQRRPPTALSPVPAPPPVQTAARVQAVGIVVDAETGAAVADALVSMDGRVARTDGAGRFALDDLPAGRGRLHVARLGYTPRTVALLLPPSEPVARLRVVVQPRTAELPPLVVDGLSTGGRAQRLGTDETPPFKEPDTLTAARSAPSAWLDTPTDALSGLRVQGALEGDYLVLLDGATTFSPPSWLNEAGPFARLAVGRVAVQRAGFGVSLGSSTAAVVEAWHRLSPEPEVTLRADPLALDGRASGPVGGRTVAMVAARASLPTGVLAGHLDRRAEVDPLLAVALTGDAAWADAPMLRGRTDPGFRDLHAALQHRGRGVETLTASAQLSERRLDTVADDGTRRATDAFAWRSYAVQANALTALRGGHLLRLRAAVSGFEQRHPFTVGAYAEAEDNGAVEAGLDGRVDFSLGEGVRAEAGGSVVYGTSWATFANLVGSASAFDAVRVRASTFGDVRLTPHPSVQAQLGARATFVGDGPVFVDPHLTLRFDGPRSPWGPWAARLSAGMYRQFLLALLTPRLSPAAPFGTHRTWLVPDSSLAVPRADQFAAELRLDPAPWLGVQAEAFQRQHLTAYSAALPIRPLGIVPQSAFLVASPVRARGVGLAAEVHGQRGTALLRLERTWAQQRLPLSNRDDLTPPFAAPLRGSLTTTARLGRQTDATVRLVVQRSGGWAYRLGDYAVAAALRADPAFAARPSAPLLARWTDGLDPAEALPSTVRLDLAATHAWTAGPILFALRGEVLNALARANPDERQRRPDGAFDRPGQPLTLSATLRATWRPARQD